MTMNTPPPKGGDSPFQQRVIVIFPALKSERHDPAYYFHKQSEAAGLAEAIHLEVVMAKVIKLERIRPSTYFGEGILEELKTYVTTYDTELLYVDSALSPVQQRNLERQLKCKVIDRTGLILEIFGARAKTAEGTLQVELAALTYQRSRLVRSWTHLERQRGGFGFLGGPGESQIELDRRLIGERIAKIRKELEQVVKTRSLHRRARQKVPYPVVALVGYTNSGKSTLFNRLTGAQTFAKDLLFATLDPTMRAVTLPSGRKIILSDTVGFISDLPTHLVAAFRATLEEVIEANVILHVRDLTSPMIWEHGKTVVSILNELGLSFPCPHQKYLELFNKVDAIEAEGLSPEVIKYLKEEGDGAKVISAQRGDHIDDLLKELEDLVRGDKLFLSCAIPAGEGKLLAWLHAHAQILRQEVEGENLILDIAIELLMFNKVKDELNRYRFHPQHMI